jgi:hypothetical protein
MLATESRFLAMAVPAALLSQRKTGIPASITIAQAIVESGWGLSKLAREANNYFGIKAAEGAPLSETISLSGYEYIGGKEVEQTMLFARYTSIADSFAHHASLIAGLPRYAPAMAVKDDPAKFATELELCGYSTAPNYAELLMELVREMDLTQYDVASPAGSQSGSDSGSQSQPQSPAAASRAAAQTVTLASKAILTSPGSADARPDPASPGEVKAGHGMSFFSFLSWIGSEFKKGFGLLKQFDTPIEDILGIVFPPAEAALEGAKAAINLVKGSVVSVEQKFSALGTQNGTGAQKLEEVLAIVEPAVTQLLAKEGIKADTSRVTEIINLVVAALNARPAPQS